MDYGSAYLVGMLIGLVIGLLVGGAIGALVLMLAARIVEKFVPRFWIAFGTALAAAVISAIVNFVAGLFIGLAGRAAGMSIVAIKLTAFPSGMVIGFLISATMIRALIKRPDGSALGFGRACLVALVQALIGLAILVVVGGGLYLLGHALGFGARPPVSM